MYGTFFDSAFHYYSMKNISTIIICLVLTSTLPAQKEDYQWIFNWARIDDCTQSNFPDFCNSSILDFNEDPPIFFRAEDATLDMDNTHTSLCDERGKLLLYSNGMSIHGADHTPIINGDTISFGPSWPNNTWLNENGEVRTQGFLGIDCAGFVPVPNQPDLYYLIYYNFDNFEITRAFDKLYACLLYTSPSPRDRG